MAQEEQAALRRRDGEGRLGVGAGTTSCMYFHFRLIVLLLLCFCPILSCLVFLPVLIFCPGRLRLSQV